MKRPLAILSLLLMGLMTLGGGPTGCSASEDQDDDAPLSEDEVKARARWNVNDVSFLFPTPAENEGDHLLAMKNGDKVLLPEAVFKLLGDQEAGVPFLVEAPGRDQLYPKLRVSAMRVDPCFDAPDPRTATGCVRQIRLTAQPLDGDHLSDASIHLFYPLDDTQFVRLMRGLRDLKAANGGNPALAVHPVMKREGLKGAFAKKLKELIVEAADASRLTRMTFMATGRSGNNWFWGILDKGANGKFTASNIPTLDRKGDGFHQNARGEEHDGAPVNSPLFPDVLLKSSAIAGLTDAKFVAAVDKLQKIENPAKLATNEMSCATCHVAATTLGHAVSKRGLTKAPSTPSLFTPPAGQNLTLTDEHEFAGNNMHAFSWFNDKVAISQRAVNESARIADFIGSEDFTKSLPPALQAEWRRR